MTVPVGTGGPETPLNYTIWAVVCAVIAVWALVHWASTGQWPAVVPGGLAVVGAVGFAVKAVRLGRRQDR